jgi:hypothetical protein
MSFIWATRELFTRLAVHLEALAIEVQRAMAVSLADGSIQFRRGGWRAAAGLSVRGVS